jgi:hypothetical protein
MTPNQKLYIGANYNRMSPKEMAKNLNIGYQSVIVFMRNNNLYSYRLRKIKAAQLRKKKPVKIPGMFYFEDYKKIFWEIFTDMPKRTSTI